MKNKMGMGHDPARAGYHKMGMDSDGDSDMSAAKKPKMGKMPMEKAKKPMMGKMPKGSSKKGY